MASEHHFHHHFHHHTTHSRSAGTYSGKSMKLGGGGRFAKLKSHIEGNVHPRAGETKAQAAGAIAASIGRAKYGAKRFASLSHKK
jgi:hypothetical protein